MMDGYSITEAATVLGVPTERVWELLARGVLAGAPEGETGMRVFLQPRPAPVPVPASFADDAGAPKSNGPDRELSPFRELLTEFRNLTERYGQALLALGESRGEVASLRSRVDLLEARIDLRLPTGNPTAPWPTQPLPAAEPASEQDDDESHRRRRRGARRATESFAEALARAEDPSPADLPGGTAAAAASAPDAAVEDADGLLPRNVLPAEPMLVAEEDAGAVAEAEEAGPPISAAPEAVEPQPPVVDFEPPVDGLEPAVDQPGPVEPEPAIVLDQVQAVAFEPAEADFEDLRLADAGAWAVPTAIADEAEPIADEAEPVAEAEPEPDAPEWSLEDEWEPSVEAGPDAERDDEPDFTIEVEPLPDPEPEASSELPPEPVATGPEEVQPAAIVEPDEPPIAAAELSPAADAQPDAVDFDAERYTSVIDQPDWFEAEADDWPPQTASGETIARNDEAEDSTPDQERPPGLEAPDPEPRESGADEMELAGGGQVAPASPEARSQGDLPGSQELDEALEAYGGFASRPAADPADEEWPPASPGGPRLSSSARAPGGYVSLPPYRSTMPSSSATRAYRRLRRIFPT
jgi:hypothetical protein